MRTPPQFAVLACAPLAAAAPPGTGQETADWWRDAVFYEVFVRSFADSTEGPLADDGVGDLRGLIERLDVLNDGEPGGDDLGVTALWLMPIAQSPSYHGYDVADYTAVDDEYGTNEDFRDLIAACEARGMRVIVDLVLNHCSSEHPWFEASRDPESPYRDWFVWRDEKPAWEHNLHMWHAEDSERGGPARRNETGPFYFGFFWRGMPDLNYDNAFVTATAYDISRTWLEDLGAHGFRLDAIRHLIERGETVASTPETIGWLEDYHRYLKSVDPACFTVGEIWGPTDEVKKYLPDSLDSAFEFQLAETIVAAVNSGQAGPLAEHLARLNEAYDDAPYSTFLTNHDQDRLMSQLGGPDDEGFAKNRLAASLLLTLPGTPFLYYGEEIGMTGTKPDPDLRTPMQWIDDPEKAGFSRAEPWRAVNPDTGAVNLADQRGDAGSLWSHYQEMIALRLDREALRRGSLTPVATETEGLLAFTRELGGERLLVLANLTDAPIRSFGVDLEGFEPGTRLRAEPLAGGARRRTGRADDEGRALGWQPVGRLAPRSVVVLGLGD